MTRNSRHISLAQKGACAPQESDYVPRLNQGFVQTIDSLGKVAEIKA
jgi:hypothetical protein